MKKIISVLTPILFAVSLLTLSVILEKAQAEKNGATVVSERRK